MPKLKATTSPISQAQHKLLNSLDNESYYYDVSLSHQEKLAMEALARKGLVTQYIIWGKPSLEEELKKEIIE